MESSSGWHGSHFQFLFRFDNVWINSRPLLFIIIINISPDRFHVSGADALYGFRGGTFAHVVPSAASFVGM